MTEKKLWERIKRVMGNAWHTQRHEDHFSSGIPDVSYGMNGVNGWIELKVTKKWPMRPKHLRAAQMNWLNSRGRTGGRCFIMVYVEEISTVMVFSAESSYDLYIGKTDAPLTAFGLDSDFKDRLMGVLLLTSFQNTPRMIA